MKNQDKFLRIYRKQPRRAFAQSLYQRLAGQKPAMALFRRALVWGLTGLLLAAGLSSNLMNLDLARYFATPVVKEEVVIEQRAPNPALLAERGLQSAAVYFPPPDVERLGPFDKPKVEPPAPVYRELAMVIVSVAERR